jgi:acetyl-CoA carboxylase biotin carboxyl carrier protein
MDVDASGPDLEAVTEEVLPALIARLRASRLGELEVRTGEWRVRLRRDPRAGTRVTAPTGSAAGDAEPEATNGSVASSTAVGYFAPVRDLIVGASVQAGDLLGTIDVLGVSQEVIAPSDGVIASVLADDGQAVEYGQALAEIDALELIVGDGEDVAG